MIISIRTVEQWTGVINEEIFLKIPEDVNFEKEIDELNYGSNHLILVDHLIKLGAEIVENPIPTYYV